MKSGLIRDFLGAGLFFVLGGVVIFGAAQLPMGTFRQPGPGAFPLAIGVALVVLAVMAAVQAQLRADAASEPSVDEAPEPWGRARVIAVCITTAAYLIVLPMAGFLAATTVLMIAFYVLGAERGFGFGSVLAGMVTAAAAYVLFVRILDVPLPVGWLWER